MAVSGLEVSGQLTGGSRGKHLLSGLRGWRNQRADDSRREGIGTVVAFFSVSWLKARIFWPEEIRPRAERRWSCLASGAWGVFTVTPGLKRVKMKSDDGVISCLPTQSDTILC